MPPNSKSTNTKSRRLKILMLHGYTQSGPLFQAKTQRIKKLLEKSLAGLPIKIEVPINGIDLFYPTGPFKVSSADLNGAEVREDANGWWKLRERGQLQEGVDVGIDQVAKVLKEFGPMDGVMGFSQGAALAAMVVSLLEPGREEAFGKVQGGMKYPQEIKELQHPPLRFGVCFSGLLNKHEAYTAFYEPKIHTPILHVLGSMDTIVEESESLALAERCADGGKGMVIRHAGTHTVPTSDRDIAAVIQFIRNAFPIEDATAKKDEEDVLDMDMPF
ncbi:FSH1-domain-containing protein, partial [Aureobasidium melanogenum]|uniref:Serine hydrolase domain-containing protein n=1 Tax=Aureobasidium melanogenum (strain CBS 110374) TaxID=1043003 RepID=A0A074WER5_AURM1